MDAPLSTPAGTNTIRVTAQSAHACVFTYAQVDKAHRYWSSILPVVSMRVASERDWKGNYENLLWEWERTRTEKRLVQCLGQGLNRIRNMTCDGDIIF
jgi:hypothetical protein